jgi:beta-phosphoglucomutase-like phosphatase (HAD superfamily)
MGGFDRVPRRAGGNAMGTAMTSPQLIIFDCDGVLVDSEPISVAVLLDMIVAAGGAIQEDVAYRLFLGRSMATIMVMLRDDFGLAVTPDHLAVMRAEIHARFRRDLKPIPGVAAILPQVGRRCVASSSQPERIRLSLELTIYSAPAWSSTASPRPIFSCLPPGTWVFRPLPAW